MTACAVTNDLHRHLAAEDAAQDKADYLSTLADDFQTQLLSGDEIKLDHTTYSLSDVVAEALDTETLSATLELLLIHDVAKGGLTDETAGTFLRNTLSCHLTKVTDDMAKIQFEMERKEA